MNSSTLVLIQEPIENRIKNIYNDKVFNCKGRKETLQSLNIYATKENQEPEDVC